jgi:hypothetical protein
MAALKPGLRVLAKMKVLPFALGDDRHVRSIERLPDRIERTYHAGDRWPSAMTAAAPASMNPAA